MPEAAALATASAVRIGNNELAAAIDATRDARPPEARMVLRTARDLSLTVGIVMADGPLRERGRAPARPTDLYDPAMNYELFMGEALAEAQVALDQGKAPIGAVAVVNDAMVARAHDRVQESNDPTAHAVVVALREASRKMGRDHLADATIFVTREPCPMCVGALLASDVEALVYAVSNQVDGAAGTVMQLAQDGRLTRKLKVVSGIRCDEAEELFAQAEQSERLRSAERLKPALG